MMVHTIPVPANDVLNSFIPIEQRLAYGLRTDDDHDDGALETSKR